jgi:hypothetical protein
LSNRDDFRENVKRAYAGAQTVLRLQVGAYDMPSLDLALKRRDKREPDRREKELADDRLSAIVMRIFRKQRQIITQKMQDRYPGRKAVEWDDLDPDEFEDEMAELVLELSKAFRGGVKLYAEALPIFDPSPLAARAAKWAASYAYDLIREINKTTIESIRNAISAFVSTPGMTIGDLVGMIPLSPDRALTIAVTETTRAFSEGQRAAGVEMREQFPDVQVFKEWFTNNDDLVCEICGPLNEKVIKFEDSFPADEEGLDGPPAHPNCRCWTSVFTDITNG